MSAALLPADRDSGSPDLHGQRGDARRARRGGCAARTGDRTPSSTSRARSASAARWCSTVDLRSAARLERRDRPHHHRSQRSAVPVRGHRLPGAVRRQGRADARRAGLDLSLPASDLPGPPPPVTPPRWPLRRGSRALGIALVQRGQRGRRRPVSSSAASTGRWPSTWCPASSGSCGIGCCPRRGRTMRVRPARGPRAAAMTGAASAVLGNVIATPPPELLRR